MTTVLSSKGQIVLNAELRRSIGLVTGTIFSVREEDGKIVLEPVTKGKPKGVLVRDRKSGTTLLEVPKGVPILTNERVKDFLTNFP